MASSSIINCNLNCICVNADCAYKHFIQYKERKIVKKFYDTIQNKTIEEPNNETRKKNCTYGQLCENKDCGFRHRLSFGSREKLIVLYKFNKICPTSKSEVKQQTSSTTSNTNTINKNLFMVLDDDTEDEIISEQIKSQPYSGKSWVSVVKTESQVATTVIKKTIIEDDCENDENEETEDDGFYMKF